MNATTTQRHVIWTPYLRPSPSAAEAALRVLSVGELDAATLALVIGSDPGLAAAVVRASEPAEMHTSMTARISGLTPSRLQSALFPALTDALAEHAGPFGESDVDSWHFALATAIAAESIARESGVANPDAAYLAGLLHNCAGHREDDRADGVGPNSFRAIGRRYRFPAWLLECLEEQPCCTSAIDRSRDSDLNRVLSLAKTMARSLVSAGQTDDATLSECATRLRIDIHCVEAARAHAAQSLGRRKSLFAFTPGATAELQSSLLRFSNQVLLFWRVDETSAKVLRNRVDHLNALRRFEIGATQVALLDEILLMYADALRAALTIDAGLVVAWSSDASPVNGIRWNSKYGRLEPLRLEVEGAHSARTIRRLFADDMWPSAEAGAVAPSILPIHSLTHRHVGYIVLSPAAARHEEWLEYISEWTTALGRAIDCVDAVERDDAHRESLRKALDDSRAKPMDRPATADRAILRQRNIASAAMAALHAPLSAVTTQAHQLVSQSHDVETQRLVEEIAKQARNAARVMGDLRTIAGSVDSPNEFILINAPLRQFLNAARPRLERRAIQLNEHLADGLPRIRADARKLHHFFTNLFAFIEHRMGHVGRTIAVSSTPSDDRAKVCLRIEVVGMAITPEQMENLFTPFENSEWVQGEFALALAACAHIVREIGGSIHVAASGDGAVFTIEFNAIHAVLAVERAAVPEEEALSVASFASIAAADSGETVRSAASVLIVDDDEVMRDLMKQALLRRGYRVDIAKDGGEAVGALDTNRFDVVLLDLLMPNQDGFAVLRDLARRAAAPPAIVMTGSRLADTRDEAMELGAHAFLQKPFELGQLLAEVESVLVHQHT